MQPRRLSFRAARSWPALARLIAGLAAVELCAGAAFAQEGGRAAVPVDVELVLAVDVSRSMNAREIEIQRQGYAAALVDPEVLAAIARGYHGQVAIAYMEWAEADHQRLVVGWTLVRDLADAEAFVARLVAGEEPTLRLTSISSAIDYAVGLFARNDYVAPRQVIDISGDGPSNDGRRVTHARDDAVANGVTINGLPLMTREGVGGRWYLENLDAYYLHCVIGGADAFVIPVHAWSDFPRAVRRKMLIELAGLPPPPPPSARARAWPAAARKSFDCQASDSVWGPPSWYQERRP